MTQYAENFSLQIPHDHICRRSLKIQSRSLKLYFGTGRTFPYNFSCVSCFHEIKTSNYKKIENKGKKKTSYKDVNVNKTG